MNFRALRVSWPYVATWVALADGRYGRSRENGNGLGAMAVAMLVPDTRTMKTTVTNTAIGNVFSPLSSNLARD